MDSNVDWNFPILCHHHVLCFYRNYNKNLKKVHFYLTICAKMRVKDLARWMDSFGLTEMPWIAEPADWATGLNLLARLLHSALAKRVEEGMSAQSAEEEAASEREEPTEQSPEGTQSEEDHQQLIRRPSQIHPSTQLPFQEALEMAEHVLGAPQFAVVADLKQGTAENQLALFVSLCTLHFAFGPADTKPYRDFQFAFRIYFDMDADGSRRECASCGQLVHLIERLVLNGQCWHRACLKCALCGRQVYRGAFHFLTLADGSLRLECLEHRANALLFGDPKHRMALPHSLSMSQHSHHPEKRFSLASMSQSQCSPPPRPPPPKIASTAPKSPMAVAAQQQQVLPNSPGRELLAKEVDDDEESIEKKIASAAAARHDAPVPRPRTSLLRQQQQQSKQTPATEKTSWEVLEYPEELNPFGSDEEEDDDEEEEQVEARKRPNGHGTSRTAAANDAAPNPFETDSEEEGESMVQLENPQDRVLASPKASSGDASDFGSGCPSPAHHVHPANAMVQLMRPVQTEIQTGSEVEAEQQPGGVRLYPSVLPLSIDCSEPESRSRQYVPPLGPMPFRLVATEKQPISGSSTSPLDHQQQLHELDTKLRRLHSQLDQWELKGARLEGQMLRELAQKENQVWRKNNKLTNEFAQLVEQRCAALAMEGLLVRRYMNAFLTLAHAELDRQKDQLAASDETRKRQFNDLLAQLLHIRNELTELDSREREAKSAMEAAKAAEKGKAEAKKEQKKEKKEKEEQKKPVEEAKQKEKDGEKKKEKKDNLKEEQQPSKEKEKGRLLKNTLKNLKKKL